MTVRLWDLDNHRPESVTTRRADGTLAASTRTTVVHEGEHDDVDLAALAERLRSHRRGPDAAGFETPDPPPGLLLVDSGHPGTVDLDEVHQQYVWWVTTTDGGRHPLRLGTDDAVLRLLASILTRELPVLAVTVEDGRPTGIRVRDRGVHTLLSPTLSRPGGDTTHLYTRLSSRLERLRDRAGRSAAPQPETDRLEALCRDLHEALTALAASGVLRPEGMTVHVLTTRARTASDLGLEILAAALDAVVERPGPEAVLRACALVGRVRSLAR